MVQKIFAGVTKSPRYNTLRALEKAFYEYSHEKEQTGIIWGVPDLTVEILSKSTRKKDQTLKVWKN